MLPLPQTAAAAPKMFLLCFGFPVLPFRPWSYSVFSYCCCSVLPATSPGGHDTSWFILFYYVILFFHVFLRPFRSSLCQRIWIASICMSYLSYPLPWQVIALSTHLTASRCTGRISVSWFCDRRACISLGGRIGTDTGCAACRRVERTVYDVKHKHTALYLSM